MHIGDLSGRRGPTAVLALARFATAVGRRGMADALAIFLLTLAYTFLHGAGRGASGRDHAAHALRQ